MTGSRDDLLLELQAGVARGEVVHFLGDSSRGVVRVLVHSLAAGRALRDAWGDAVDIVQSRWSTEEINRFNDSIASIPASDVTSHSGGINLDSLQPYVKLTVRANSDVVTKVRREVPAAYLTIVISGCL